MVGGISAPEDSRRDTKRKGAPGVFFCAMLKKGLKVCLVVGFRLSLCAEAKSRQRDRERERNQMLYREQDVMYVFYDGGGK